MDILPTSNPSLIKTSSNALGISEHDMVVTDCDDNDIIRVRSHANATYTPKQNGKIYTKT